MSSILKPVESKTKHLDYFLSQCHRRKYPSKSTIIYAGDKSDSLFYIVKGSVTVIIEDDAFVGSRCIIVEGIRVEREAVLGANVVLTASTKIIDVSGDEPIECKGVVPERSVVIPGTYTKQFPAGEYQVPCALIIGKRKESTNKKTSLNDALREHNVAV